MPHILHWRLHHPALVFFFDSLRNIAQIECSSYRRMLNELDNLQSKTIFLLGVPFSAIKSSEQKSVIPDGNMMSGDFKELYEMAQKGANIVVAFAPEKQFFLAEKTEKTKKKQKETKEELYSQKSLISKKLILTKVTDAPEKIINTLPSEALCFSDKKIPEKIKFCSNLYFSSAVEDKLLADDFEVLYKSGDYPVVIEKDFANGGRLVLFSDSYLFSNEAMKKEQIFSLISYLIGRNKEVLFSEAHFGLFQQRNVLWLLRKFKLELMVVTLLILCLFYCWKCFFEVPKRSADEFVKKHQLQKVELSLLATLKSVYNTKQLMAVICNVLQKHMKSMRLNKQQCHELEDLLRNDKSIKGYNQAVEKMKSFKDIYKWKI